MNEDKKVLESELWTVQEYAQWAKMSPDAVRCRYKRGQFPKGTYVHIGRSLRFVANRIREWLLGQAS